MKRMLPREDDVLARWVLLTVTVAGVVLRLYTYARQTSLWIDEVAILRNVVDRSVRQIMLSPLDYGQVAPKGFLLLIKALVAIGGVHEYVVRLPALIGSVAALLLFAILVRRLMSGAAAAAAVCLVAVSPIYLEQSAQLKPYSTDFAISMMVLFFAMAACNERLTLQRAVLFGGAGAAGALLSQHAVLTLFACAVVVCAYACATRDRVNILRSFAMTALWGAGAVVSMLLALHSFTPALNAYMNAFWKPGFMPIPPKTLEQWMWPLTQLQRVASQTSSRIFEPGGAIAIASALLMICGLVLLWRQQRRLAAMASACLLTMLVASAAGKYPFAPFKGSRLVLFEFSLLLLVMLLPVAWLEEWLANRFPAARAGAALLAAAIAAPSVYAVVTMPPPYIHDTAAELLAFVHEHWQDGDRLYASDGIGLDVLQYGMSSGIPRAATTIGSCSLRPKTWLTELDAFRGGRLWIIVANGRDEGKLLDTYLSIIGRRVAVASVAEPGTWAVYANFGPTSEYEAPFCALYDLRDAQRSARYTGRAFRVPKSMKFYSAPWWCYGVFRPLVRESGIPARW